MKKRTTLLLTSWLLLAMLSSCILSTVPAGTTAGTDAETAPPITEAETLPPIPGGLWSEEDAMNAAALLLRHPTGGVVDISHADYSYEEMTADLETLAKVYPRYFSTAVLGQTVAGRDIPFCVLGDQSAPRQVVVTAAIHAREYMTAQLVMKSLEFYLQNYTKGSYGGVPYSTLFSEVCFYIVPMANPDGVMLAQQGLSSLPAHLQARIRGIYETEKHSDPDLQTFLSHWKANANGVDLNRNYDVLWEEYKGSDIPASYQYKGPSPASEPETKALLSLLTSLSNVVCSLCIHSQGEVIYWNCGQTGSAADATRTYAHAVSALNGYYVVPGRNNDASLSDWCELRLGVVSITVETGNVACPLPLDQFPDLFLDNYLLFAMTARHF